MRVLLAASFVIASIASAPAQSAPDAGRAADPSSARPAPDAPPKPNPPANFFVNGSATIPAAPARTPQQRKADDAAQAAWRARCRPTAIEDADGIRRTHYAESDCDLSSANAAGAH